MVSKRIVLTFPHSTVGQPIVYRLVKDYGLTFNILQAKITPQEEGVMVLELKGKKEDYAAGIKYLTSLGVNIQPISQDVTRDEARCTHCGACVTVCPSGALYTDKKTMKIIFDAEKCIACELCVKACPPRAMVVKL
ncbi:MAG: NIL domain-containing protein [Candidatus Omnitrophota bacterium]